MDALPGVAHAKVALCYVKEVFDAGMRREFAEAVRACYKAGGTDWIEISSVAVQRAFVRSSGAKCTSGVAEIADDQVDNRDFEGMKTAKEVATSGIRGRVREVQRVFEKGVEAVPTTIINVVEIACEVFYISREHATSSDRNTIMGAKLVVFLLPDARCTVRLRLWRTLKKF